MLKLWGRANSINVQKVCWALDELGVQHERIDAGMAFGRVNEPWFRAMNPNGTVPVIDDGGVIVWESNAIVRYLAATRGRLIANDPAERARCEMWMDWQQNVLMPGMSPLFLGLVRTPVDKRDVQAIEAGRKSVEDGMRILDTHLAGRHYVAIADFSVADLALGVVAYRWKALPIARPSLAHLDAWYARLAQRPAFQRHVMLPLT